MRDSLYYYTLIKNHIRRNGWCHVWVSRVDDRVVMRSGHQKDIDKVHGKCEYIYQGVYMGKVTRAMVDEDVSEWFRDTSHCALDKITELSQELGMYDI